jgi:hypothetical protein
MHLAVRPKAIELRLVLLTGDLGGHAPPFAAQILTSCFEPFSNRALAACKLLSGVPARALSAVALAKHPPDVIVRNLDRFASLRLSIADRAGRCAARFRLGPQCSAMCRSSSGVTTPSRKRSRRSSSSSIAQAASNKLLRRFIAAPAVGLLRAVPVAAAMIVGGFLVIVAPAAAPRRTARLRLARRYALPSARTRLSSPADRPPCYRCRRRRPWHRLCGSGPLRRCAAVW